MKRVIMYSVYVIFSLLLAINVIAVPSVSNVRVLPDTPNAGQDLLCNYTYSSTENYTEQNSSFEWWKNSINQNINSQILAKGNLSVGDSWYCRVTGSDGLNFSSIVQSSNSVTILNTTQNPRMYVNGSVQWNESGYYADSKEVLDFTTELNIALENCTMDTEGFCTIPISISSTNNGILNLSDLGIYYTETPVSLKIDSLTEEHTNGTLKIFEFVILNDGGNAVTNVQWWFDTNDSNVINSTPNFSSMAVNEKAFVYMKYNFSDEGSYNVKANATGTSYSRNLSSSLSSTVSIGDLAITSFGNSNQDGNKVILEIQAKNHLAENLTNLNWSLATGDGQNINSTSPFTTIKPNETVFIFVNYDYGKSGGYNLTASTTNGTYSDSKSLTLDIRHIEAFNLSVVNESNTKKIFEFVIKNSFVANLTNVSWTFDTKNSNVINSTITTILQPNEQIYIFLDYNFTTTGTFNVNGTGISGDASDYRNLTITVT